MGNWIECFFREQIAIYGIKLHLNVHIVASERECQTTNRVGTENRYMKANLFNGKTQAKKCSANE